MSDLSELCGRRAQEAADGLLATIELLVRSGGRGRVPGVVVELYGALLQAASDTGSATERAGSMDVVREWTSAEVAGRAVGMTGRRVRQLCADGRVVHRRLGARSLVVDVDDLQRHIRTRRVP
ncbi:hypothetical protein DQ244_06095 [Blastococcus sp. TBT05-19]|nr:hypothetical protein DQ244_06095 [Blastococcus sp. TBT05-19]